MFHARKIRFLPECHSVHGKNSFNGGIILNVVSGCQNVASIFS